MLVSLTSLIAVAVAPYAIPYDYDDVIAASKIPTLVVAPDADRMTDQPALLKLLAQAAEKLGPSYAHLLTVNATGYVPPTPHGQHALPAQGINRLANNHQAALLGWLHRIDSDRS
jgi:hypothetical protein